MSYDVRISMRGMADKLAEIERGNPVRNYVVPTLHAATALCNVARMAAGLPMERGPRSLPLKQVYTMGRPVDVVFCEIERVRPRAQKGKP